MAAVFPLFLALVVTFHTTHSYILLTANIEDVQTLAKQLASSPVVDQIHKIWRRASSQFNDQVSKSKPHKRAKDDLEDIEVKPGAPNQNDEATGYVSEGSNNGIQRRSQDHDDLVALGKNASMYLKSIKKLFENV